LQGQDDQVAAFSNGMSRPHLEQQCLIWFKVVCQILTLIAKRHLNKEYKQWLLEK